MVFIQYLESQARGHNAWFDLIDAPTGVKRVRVIPGWNGTCSVTYDGILPAVIVDRCDLAEELARGTGLHFNLEKTYKVEWTRTYHRTGVVDIVATSANEARRIALENIGDYEGSMQYDPDNDFVEVI